MTDPMRDLLNNPLEVETKGGELDNFTKFLSLLQNNFSQPEITGLDKFNAGLGAFGSLGGLYLGKNQLDLGKKQLGQNIRAFETSYNAQRDQANEALFDRQRFRARQAGLSPEEANAQAQSYVDSRGIKSLR